MVCDKDPYLYLATSLIFVSWAVGAVALGWLSDRYQSHFSTVQNDTRGSLLEANDDCSHVSCLIFSYKSLMQEDFCSHTIMPTNSAFSLELFTVTVSVSIVCLVTPF